MPTFNQLVRKGREVMVKKSTAPALLKGYNSQKKAYTCLLYTSTRNFCGRWNSALRRSPLRPTKVLLGLPTI